MIPKKIYYIWLGGNPLPEEVQVNIATWRQCNPDYEIIEINESNCDLDQYQFVRTAYDHQYWAFASDVVRLQTIYEHGGFYFDTDVKMLKSLDDLRSYPSVWAMENSGEVASGLILAAEPHDENIKSILDIYKHKQFDPDDIYAAVTVGIISKFFETKGLKDKNVKQVLSDGTLILPTPYFAPYHYWSHSGRPTKKCYAIQQYSDTWGADTNFTFKTRFLADMRLHCPSLFKTLVSLKKRIIG
ncbi:glycosyltransferase family 32 protein [Lactiplantibacillus plantarum]|uniref:glycosyltransferase family 32 protein n=1 Tax=Lactiplantibacillus plantarum TaxID=1590 RepID=UPI0009755BFC|nr:glycosyltransferase [Lactiplantibacillus plantarum]